MDENEKISGRIDRILSEEEGHLSMVNFIHTDVFQKGLLVLADVVNALRGAMFAKERFHTEIDYDAEAQSVTVVTRVREDDNDGMCPEAVRGLWTRPQEDTARHE